MGTTLTSAFASGEAAGRGRSDRLLARRVVPAARADLQAGPIDFHFEPAELPVARRIAGLIAEQVVRLVLLEHGGQTRLEVARVHDRAPARRRGDVDEVVHFESGQACRRRLGHRIGRRHALTARVHGIHVDVRALRAIEHVGELILDPHLRRRGADRTGRHVFVGVDWRGQGLEIEGQPLADVDDRLPAFGHVRQEVHGTFEDADRIQVPQVIGVLLAGRRAGAHSPAPAAARDARSDRTAQAAKPRREAVHCGEQAGAIGREILRVPIVHREHDRRQVRWPQAVDDASGDLLHRLDRERVVLNRRVVDRQDEQAPLLDVGVAAHIRRDVTHPRRRDRRGPRNVHRAERRDLLRHAVLEDGEIRRDQSAHGPPILVEHRHVQAHEIDAGPELRRRRLSRLGRGRWRRNLLGPDSHTQADHCGCDGKTSHVNDPGQAGRGMLTEVRGQKLEVGSEVSAEARGSEGAPEE